MYSLTLTKEERKAIDWVGNRYAHGEDLFRILINSDCSVAWDSNLNATFELTESSAHQVVEIAEACSHQWDCFSRELVSKLELFVEGVI